MRSRLLCRGLRTKSRCFRESAFSKTAASCPRAEYKLHCQGEARSYIPEDSPDGRSKTRAFEARRVAKRPCRRSFGATQSMGAWSKRRYRALDARATVLALSQAVYSAA